MWLLGCWVQALELSTELQKVAENEGWNQHTLLFSAINIKVFYEFDIQ